MASAGIARVDREFRSAASRALDFAIRWCLSLTLFLEPGELRLLFSDVRFERLEHPAPSGRAEQPVSSRPVSHGDLGE